MTARGARAEPIHIESDDLHVPGAEPRTERRAARCAPEPTGQIARLEAWLDSADIALGTYASIRAAGQGPRTFLIGRRVYIHRDDWHAWCRRLAESGGIRLRCQKQTGA